MLFGVSESEKKRKESNMLSEEYIGGGLSFLGVGNKTDRKPDGAYESWDKDGRGISSIFAVVSIYLGTFWKLI